MSSKRKIWSIPISLALVLVLVASVGLYSIVQAQTVGSSHTFFEVQGGTDPIGTVTVRGLTTGETGTGASNDEVITEDNDNEGAVLSGTGSAGFIATVGARVDIDPDPTDDVNPVGTQPIVIGVNGAAIPDAGVYNLTLTINVDLDDDTDGPDAETTDLDNDVDRTITTSITIYVVGAPQGDDRVPFTVDPSTAFEGERVSTFGRDLRTNAQYIQVTGLGPNSKINGDTGATGFDAEEGILASISGLAFSVDPNDGSRIIAKASGATFSAADIDFDVSVDPDTTDDTDTPLTIAIDANLATTTSIDWAADPNDPPFSYTVLSTDAAGTVVGEFEVASAATDVDPGTAGDQGEFLDGILLDENGAAQSMFSVRGANAPATGDTTLQVMYTGSGTLTTGTMTFRLSVNGDSGIAHRTISNGGDDNALENLTITVNPVNEGPTGDDSLVVTVRESDDEDGQILDVGDVIADVSSLVTDTDVLTYSISDTDEDANNFEVGSDGVVKVARAIVDNAEAPPAADAEEDDPPTYMRGDATPADTTNVVDDGGELVDDSNEFSDLTYEFTVNVSDGNAASSHDIDVTLTVDVNEPVALVKTAADLPAGVTYESVMRDLNDPATPNVATDDTATDTYRITVRAGDRDTPLEVIDLNTILSDDDAGSLEFDELGDDGDASHLVQEGSGSLLLTYIPPNSEEPGRTNWVEVSATDGVNDDGNDPADSEDVSFYVEVTVIEHIVPITSNFVSITVAENGTDCSQEGVASGCSVAGVVTGAATYSVESGVDGGDTNYAVADDGSITVQTAPDFEDGLNPAFLVNANNSDGDLAGLISVRVTVTDVPEAPVLTELVSGADDQATEIPWVYETAQIGDDVLTKPAGQMGGTSDDPATVFVATDEDADATITYSIDESGIPFAINASTGALTVSGALDRETATSHTFTVRATDEDGLDDDMSVTVHVLNANEAPIFTSPTGDDAVTIIPENTPNSVVIFTFTATDEDGDDLEFNLREGQSRDLFVIEGAGSNMVNGVEVWSGELHVKTGVTLDYEDAGYDPRVHVEANDPEGLNATLLLTVDLSNVNDNEPAFDNTPATQLSVAENTVRGTTLSNYSATDADGDTVTYSLNGGDAGSFSIDGYGNLMTLESLDADRQVPCGSDGCAVEVVASDGTLTATANVRITVTAVEDSVSTLDVSKANPVPGTEMGNPMSALSNAKDGGYEYLWNQLDCAGMLDLVGASDNAVNRAAYCHMWDGMTDANQKKVRDTYIAMGVSAPAESPYDLPATYGSSPMNFVETEWANWGTVLRIEVTAEAPDASCGNGNQCVVINVNSDSADDSLKLEAYRVDTPAGSASRENHFVAALMLVELSGDATPGDAAVYSGVKGGVAALKVDEEDEVEVEFGNLRDTIDVENEAPEVSNFAPEHERAFDDADVDYTFTIMDDHSGLPEPEDLPDNDGDENYTPVVALISKSEGGAGQCSVATTPPKGADSVLNFAAHIHEDDTLYCPGRAQEGEYVASEGGFGFAPIRDDKDFDEIDNGYDVETTIVLTENDTYYVTFIVCDNAGNCAYHDPDGNDDNEELAEITVDTLDPVFVEARTGLNWDSTDNEYDDDRNYIQVIFNDLTTLNPATVEVDDFVVEGHTIESVTVYENPDDDDVNWGDSGRYAKEGHRNLRYIDRYRDLENAVFIELADELLADETPDVTIVPNGVEDGAGNEQDDGDHEADDWISPKFTVVSITSTLETAQDEVLAGDGDEITLVVTADERLDATRPTVVVTYVNAPAGSVDTKGTMSCKVDKDTNGSRDRGEIVLTDYCQDSSAAKGGTLNNSVEKVSNTEWIVTVTEPKDTGYYSFRISGVDRSPQENPGSEGIAADSIVTDFFDSDGDVNTDDAVFWEGDINLANPNVRVSGNVITDNEPDIEYRSPLFVEIDFTANHWSSVDCRGEDDNDNVLANCMNENSEYAEDNFDDIVITMFELDGVDMTDSVKTTDDQTFLVTLENVALGDHTARIQAMDVAGNTLEDVLEIDFEVSDRDPFERRLNPGWNLVSLPGEPADSSIGSVFGPGVEVRTVYTYDPVVPGGWMVAVRETLDSDWQGDLTEITGTRGYWVLSDAIQDWEVSIPRLAGGAAGTGTPIQPPVIALYAGWNLIPVTDISGNGSGGDTVSADVYLQNLDDGLDLARVLGFDTIRNQWYTVLDPDMQMNNTLTVGSGYWIFVREAASLVPSGYISGGGSD